MTDQRLEKIQDDITEIKLLVTRNTITLEANTADMKEHIRRTALLEEQMQVALLPVRFFRWFVAALSIAGTIAGIIRVFLIK